MHLGFYGHSSVSWTLRPINSYKPFSEKDEGSFIDIVCKHYNSILVNKGVLQGSIERVLVDLKKTKKIDFAFIFYSGSNRFYLPRTNRDIDLKHFNEFFKDTKAKYIWNVQKNQSKNIIWNIEKWHSERVKKAFYSQGENIEDVYDSIEEFITTLSLYKKYLYDPEVHLNRWYGSLIQIDQYLYAKKIPCIHVIDNNMIPPWFKFKSGIVAPHIDALCKKYHDNSVENSISIPGQKIIAEALIAEVEKFTNNSPLTTDK